MPGEEEQTVWGSTGRREKDGLDRRIVGLPNRNSVKLGVGHERKDAGNKGFSKAVALQLLHSL